MINVATPKESINWDRPLSRINRRKNHRNAKSGDHQERIHAIFLPSCANFWLFLDALALAIHPKSK